jgi:hypothetical protein
MNSTQKFYLEVLPYEKSEVPRTHGFKFDMECKKWYTNNSQHPLLKDFKKVYINFKGFRTENFLYFDNDTKQWYTYTSNETFKDYHED